MTDSERIANLETAVRLLAERCDQLLAMMTELALVGRDLTAEFLRKAGVSESQIQAAIAAGRSKH